MNDQENQDICSWFQSCAIFKFIWKVLGWWPMTGSCRGCDNTKQVINGHTGVHNDKPSPNLWFMSGYKPHKDEEFHSPLFLVLILADVLLICRSHLGWFFQGIRMQTMISPHKEMWTSQVYSLTGEQSLAVPKGLRSCRTDTRHSLEVENGETMRVWWFVWIHGIPLFDHQTWQ